MKAKEVEFWAKSCLRKKRLKEEWAKQIIQKAKKEGNYLRSYLCKICCHYHVTKTKQNTKERL